MKDKEELKKEIIEFGRLLIDRGLVTGTGGNISICLRDKGQILITPSGMNYDVLVPEDIVVMDMECNVLGGCRKPSIEKNMHLAIYQSRPDVGAVVHTHSCYASAVAITRQDLPPVLDVMAAVFGGSVRTARYAPIGTRVLAENVVEALGESPAALLANHGVVGVGGDLASAFDMCELTEACARSYIFSHLVGAPVVLTEKEVKDEKEDLEKRYGQK